MGLTPNYAIPYPELPDPADIPYYSKAQAEKVDEILGEAVLRAVPAGSVFSTVISAAPVGYLMCNGDPVLDADSDLYALLVGQGSPFGSSAGSPRTPDLRGRVAVGYDTGQAEFNTLGETGGEKKHTLTVDEMPTHSHASPSGTGSFVIGVDTPKQVAAGTDRAGPSPGQPVANNTKVAGLGLEHQNMPPYIALNWIIKT